MTNFMDLDLLSSLDIKQNAFICDDLSAEIFVCSFKYCFGEKTESFLRIEKKTWTRFSRIAKWNRRKNL